jgi:hypothetical protein
MLPKYVPDNLLEREITYQIVEKESLPTYQRKKKVLAIFPLYIGRYTLSNKPHAKNEVEALRELCLCTLKYKMT